MSRIDGTGTIGEYTTSGGTVNATLVSGLSEPEDIAVSGSNVFVTSSLLTARLASTPRREAGPRRGCTT